MKRRGAAHIIVAIALAWALPSLIMSEGFVAGTVIATSRGHVPIEDLQPGDDVFAADFTGRITNDYITQIYQHPRNALVRISIDHQTILTDADHLFFLPCTQRWVCAKELKCGDILLEGPLTAHQITGVERHEMTATCYSLSLATHHTYLVSQKNIVVHNCSDITTFPRLAIEATRAAPFLTAFLAANPWLVPGAILAGGAGLTGYLIWSLVSGGKQAAKNVGKKHSSSANQLAASTPTGPQVPPEDDQSNNNKKQRAHPLSKSEFSKLMKERLKHYRGDYYRVEPDVKNGQPKDGCYCNFDHRHGDVEFYNKHQKHLGSWAVTENGEWVQRVPAQTGRTVGD